MPWIRIQVKDCSECPYHAKMKLLGDFYDEEDSWWDFYCSISSHRVARCIDLNHIDMPSVPDDCPLKV